MLRTIVQARARLLGGDLARHGESPRHRARVDHVLRFLARP
jgi:hypothetical protein